MSNKIKIDVLVLLLLIALSVSYLFLVEGTFLDLPYLTSYTFIISPIIYLSLRKKKDWSKILAAVFLFGFVIGFPFTFIGELTNAWAIHVDSYKMLGVFFVPIVIAWMLMVALTVVVYQHFFPSLNTVKKGISERFKKVTLVASILSLLMVVTCIYNPTFFPKKYSYLIIGSVILAPFLVYLIKKPRFIVKILPLMSYFFVMYFTLELIGLKLEWWSFQGSYIGFVNLFEVRFPVEELMYWMILFPLSTISCYQSFINTKK
ncbi:hypothetical protein [Pseudotenacibaculum haliotis]|uniref:Lycopene cyclase domain-containing protein n=1 Tax=Pseudotenacibaculum haliotis TaxID=1862138 RepID=A0ABW5LNW8_9FLAO